MWYILVGGGFLAENWAVGLPTILVFAVFQAWAFIYVWNNLKRYLSFFPKDVEWEEAEIDGLSRIKCDGLSGDAKDLAEEINEYLSKNEGMSDFGVLKDKTEQRLDTIYEAALSKVSVPTLLGLAGTFVGVFIGLMRFGLGLGADGAGGDAGITEDMVSRLIGGIIISMLTSVVGLILMIVGHLLASAFQKEVEQRKSKFYSFLQVELLPSSGTSAVSALNKLSRTIGRLNPTFTEIIAQFKQGFKECTEQLRGSFGENVRELTAAVDLMRQNMTLVNENVRRQDELLRTMRQGSMLETLERFNEAAGSFGRVTEAVGALNEVKDDIAGASRDMVVAQVSFCSKMSESEAVFERITAILDRVSTFEESINALGRDINQSNLLGNLEINVIREQLDDLSKKSQMVAEHQQMSLQDLSNIYTETERTIKELNTRYNALLEQYETTLGGALGGFKEKVEKAFNDVAESIGNNSLGLTHGAVDPEPLKAIDRKLSQLNERTTEVANALASIKDAVGDGVKIRWSFGRKKKS